MYTMLYQKTWYSYINIKKYELKIQNNEGYFIMINRTKYTEL